MPTSFDSTFEETRPLALLDAPARDAFSSSKRERALPLRTLLLLGVAQLLSLAGMLLLL